MKFEQTECYETLTYKIQTPGNYPEESIKPFFSFLDALNFLYYYMFRRGYSHLKEEALDRTMWRNRFRGGFGPVVRQNTE